MVWSGAGCFRLGRATDILFGKPEIIFGVAFEEDDGAVEGNGVEYHGQSRAGVVRIGVSDTRPVSLPVLDERRTV